MDSDNKSNVNADEQEVKDASAEVICDENKEIECETLENIQNEIALLEQTLTSEEPENMPVTLPNEITKTIPETLVSQNQSENETIENIQDEITAQLEQSLTAKAAENLPVTLPNEITETVPETLISQNQSENETLENIQNEITAQLEQSLTTEAAENFPVTLPSEISKTVPDPLVSQIQFEYELSETLENIQNEVSAHLEQSITTEVTENLPVTLPNEITKTVPETLISQNQSENETLENIQNKITSQLEQSLTAEAAKNLSNEISKTVPETLVSQSQSDEVESSAVGITLKKEPYSEEIDYGMPIAKTPIHTSFSESCEPLDNVNEFQRTNNLLLDKFQSKSALDEYLDGMVTPIVPPVPRLRVKTELALFKPPQSEAIQEKNDLNKSGETTNTEICDPPPPPNLSANCNSDFVADGIATPRISLASINRLRVKPEFSLSSTVELEKEVPNVDYFNDRMNTKTLEREDGEVSPEASDDGSENEEIPSDYFDDLLIDKLKEKIDNAQNNDLEVKYSDRLKELENLKDELRRIEEKKARKVRKKQKKSKKKSKKRSRSRSLSPHGNARERNLDDLPNTYYEHNKRSRMSPSHLDQPTSSNYVSRQVPVENVLRLEARYKDIKTEFSANELDDFAIEEVLTPKQKRERANKRATALLYYLKCKSDGKSDTFSEFPFVSTVRKLPSSHSYVQQQLHENRSPLHSVNNVNYTFNSHSSRFKMEEWGLAALPPVAAKQAKLVGCDAEFIHNKLKTIKIPAKLKILAQEPNKDTESDEQEELVETASSLFSNAMTQTDSVDELVGQCKQKGYDIGVQAQSESYSIGCQTLETIISPKQKDELPLMKVIQDLNENQLMAIHAFAELIKEQKANSNAMEMYKVQMQIMDIYKMSQIPSALDSEQPAIVNSYTTRPPEQGNLCIQSVKGADGRQFSVNDPRSKSASYAQRNAYDDQRYNHQQSYAARPSTSKTYSQTYFSATSEPEGRYNTASAPTRHHPYNVHSSQPSPSTAKRYGRGALRR